MSSGFPAGAVLWFYRECRWLLYRTGKVVGFKPKPSSLNVWIENAKKEIKARAIIQSNMTVKTRYKEHSYSEFLPVVN